MERYKITNWNGTIVLERGDNLNALLQSQRQSDFVKIGFFGDAPTWRVVWEYTERVTDPFSGEKHPSEYVAIDKFFYGDKEPEQDVTPEIDRDINAYYDYISSGWETE